MVFYDNFCNIFLLLVVIIPLIYYLGYGLLVWSGLLGQEYKEELSVFIPVSEPVAGNRFLVTLSVGVPLCCLGVAYYLHGGQLAILLSVLVVSLFLVQYTLTDFLWQIIFDKQLALFTLLGLLRLLLTGDGLLDGLMAAVVGFVAFFLLAVITRGGFGGGDVKLIGAMGLWLGSQLLFTTVIMGTIIGGLMALILLIAQKRSRREYFPYGPYFALSGMILFLLTVH